MENSENKAQLAAKTCLGFLERMFIHPDSTEYSLQTMADLYLNNNLMSLWYPTIVLVNGRTTWSGPGKDYSPEKKNAGLNALLTIDVHPKLDGEIGDYAKTIIVKDGLVLKQYHFTDDRVEALGFVSDMHGDVMRNVLPSWTFGDLHEYAMHLLSTHKFRPLGHDFGYGIDNAHVSRTIIKKGSKQKLSEVKCFTFGPHVGTKDGKYGVKTEEMYHFVNGRLAVL